MKRTRQGFTLVELLAVIVVLAIIMVITIPAVMGVTAQAKKESFFLYAQSLQSKAISKYTQDLEYNSGDANCAVYDIEKDLGLSDTGNYEGWIMVSRSVSNENTGGRKTASITLENSAGLEYVRYCTAKGTSCTPDQSYRFPEGSKKVTIEQNIDKGYVMCARYEYASGGQLVSSKVQCQTYEQGKSAQDSYTYSVKLSMKDKDYAVEAASISEDMSEEEFTKKMYTNSTLPEDRNAFVVFQPSCSGGVTSIAKGETEDLTTIVTTAKTTERSTEVEKTTSTTERSTAIQTTSTTTRDTEIITTGSTTNRDDRTSVISTTEPIDPNDPNRTTIITTEPTTTIDINDTSLLLNTLNVVGYDIGFSPLKFYYEMTVPNNVTSLTITATTTTADTVYDVAGADSLVEGRNVVIITLFNQVTGKESKYRIIVNRYTSAITTKVTGQTKTTIPWTPESGMPDPNLEESNASLQQLSVSGYAFEFQPEVYEYTLQTHGETKLNILAKGESETSTVIVTGQDNVSDGSEIIIDIRSANGYYKKQYKIKIEFLDETSNSTKIIRGVAVGTGVVLVAALLTVQLTKKRKSRMIDDVLQQENKDLTQFDSGPNNNNQGSV